MKPEHKVVIATALFTLLFFWWLYGGANNADRRRINRNLRANRADLRRALKRN